MSVQRTEDIETCLRLRRIVFIEDQGVPEHEEVDGRDSDAVHFLARLEGRAVGTARVLTKGDTIKIGRVCVLPEARGADLGKALIRAALDWGRENGFLRAQLGAQLHALGFYEALGFMAFGPVFDDAGIPHRAMDIAL